MNAMYTCQECHRRVYQHGPWIHDYTCSRWVPYDWYHGPCLTADGRLQYGRHYYPDDPNRAEYDDGSERP